MSKLNYRVLTRFGHPNWIKILNYLHLQHKSERIGVFYSVADTLDSVLFKLSHNIRSEEANSSSPRSRLAIGNGYRRMNDPIEL